ncbi:MAG: hypothetical protein KC584_18010 [Nitrospira sp.]|nr:hypothetical protein [Nitrospira sp.]
MDQWLLGYFFLRFLFLFLMVNPSTLYRLFLEQKALARKPQAGEEAQS